MFSLNFKSMFMVSNYNHGSAIILLSPSSPCDAVAHCHVLVDAGAKLYVQIIQRQVEECHYNQLRLTRIMTPRIITVPPCWLWPSSTDKRYSFPVRCHTLVLRVSGVEPNQYLSVNKREPKYFYAIFHVFTKLAWAILPRYHRDVCWQSSVKLRSRCACILKKESRFGY